jgi:hypothetical protein
MSHEGTGCAPEKFGENVSSMLKQILLSAVSIFLLEGKTFSQSLPDVGVEALREFDSSLQGNGIIVAQPEASAGDGVWQVNPSVVQQPASRFSWTANGQTAISFPNALGSESGHADTVGAIFYGLSGGIAPGVGQIDCYEAKSYNNLIGNLSPIRARISNHSFVLIPSTPENARQAELFYDHFAARYNTTLICAVGNGGPPFVPSTAFNTIAVGARDSDGTSSVGPTTDGRCKPDITAPGSLTSFSTPLVSGVATLLMQAALRGDGGLNSTLATNSLVIKALLLNGAAKPGGWTNGVATPLDARHGAGVVNALNSYRQLRGRKLEFAASTKILSGDAHPVASGTESTAFEGWDLNSISGTVVQDGVNHYLLDTRSHSNGTFVATLTWARAQNQTTINNLDLFLLDAESGALITNSISPVDNVEHLYVPSLPAGRYDLQVLKHGGVVVSSTEIYGLAFALEHPAPRFAIESLEGGKIRLLISGEPNQTYRVESGTNLTSWTPLSTNITSASGAFSLNRVTGTRQEFYRVRLFP